MHEQTAVVTTDSDTHSDIAGTAAPARPRQWLALAVLTLPAFLIALDFSVLNLAVPAISRDLKPSSGQLLWIVDVYGFMLAGFLVTMGALGDRIGRRRLLTLGAVGFGIAGATLMPSTLSLISQLFPQPRQRTLALAIWSTSLPVGGAVGPLVGGALLQAFRWGSVFLVAVPVMVLLVATAPVLLPEHRSPSSTRPDPLSVVLAPTAILAAVFGLQDIAEHGFRPAATVAGAVGIIAGWGFVRRQRVVTDPLLDLSLLRMPRVRVGLVVNMLAFFVILGMSLLIAQYLQQVRGLAPLRAGLCTLPMMAGLILGELSVPLLLRHMRPVHVMTGGLIVAAGGFALLTPTPLLDTTIVVTASAVFAAGLAPVTTLVVGLVLENTPPHRAGAASGLSETTTELGGALGIAVLGSIAATVYRHHITNHLPTGLPANTRDAVADTLTGATTAQLPHHIAAATLDAAHHAFTTGLSVTAGICAAIAITLAALTATRLDERADAVSRARHRSAR